MTAGRCVPVSSARGWSRYLSVMLSSLAERLRRWLVRAAEFRPDAETRRRLAVAALAVFLLATGIALAHLPEVSLSGTWLSLLVPLVVMTVALNAFEFHLVARLSGVQVGVRRALEVTIWSRAANLLPLPGGAVVRAHDLASSGGGWSTPARALIATAVASLGVSLAAVAAAVAVTGRPLVASLFTLAAVAATGLILVVLPATRGRTGRWALALLALRAVFVLVAGLRFFVVCRALALPVPLVTALAFSLASSVASAVGIFPDGLGIREMIAGAIAPLVGIEVAVGISVTALDRVVSFALIAAVAGLLSLASSGKVRPGQGETPGSESLLGPDDPRPGPRP